MGFSADEILPQWNPGFPDESLAAVRKCPGDGSQAGNKPVRRQLLVMKLSFIISGQDCSLPFLPPPGSSRTQA